MKSAYELAMERLEKSSPTRSLTDEQKAQLSEVDSLYQSKIAERETFLKAKMEAARFAGNALEAEQFRTQLARDISDLREEWDAKKQSLRKGYRP